MLGSVGTIGWNGSGDSIAILFFFSFQGWRIAESARREDTRPAVALGIIPGAGGNYARVRPAKKHFHCRGSADKKDIRWRVLGQVIGPRAAMHSRFVTDFGTPTNTSPPEGSVLSQPQGHVVDISHDFPPWTCL